MRSIARIFIASAFLLAGGAALGWLPADEIPPGLPPDWERPPEEALTPLPSLDPAEREELRERLETLHQLYHAKVWEARAEHYGITLEELDRRLWRDDGSLPNWRRVTQTMRAPLRPEHDPWLLDTALGLLQEDPIDWRTLREATRTLNRSETGPSPEREQIARQILEEPLPSEMLDEHRWAVASSMLYFLRQWPENAPEVLEVLYTLPVQPGDREILPVEEGAPRPEEAERLIAQRLRNLAPGLDPSQASELLGRIEASLAAGAYTLDQEGERRLGHLRESAGWRGTLNRLTPW